MGIFSYILHFFFQVPEVTDRGLGVLQSLKDTKETSTWGVYLVNFCIVDNYHIMYHDPFSPLYSLFHFPYFKGFKCHRKFYSSTFAACFLSCIALSVESSRNSHTSKFLGVTFFLRVLKPKLIGFIIFLVYYGSWDIYKKLFIKLFS